MTVTRVVIDIETDKETDRKSVLEIANSFGKGVLTDTAGYPEVEATASVHVHDGAGCDKCNRMTYDGK